MMNHTITIYLKKTIIHVSQYMYSLNEIFPSRLSILSPRAKDHLTKASTPGIGSPLLIVGQDFLRDSQNITGYCYCPE